MTITVGSLFSGIGGIDLGLERAGMKVIWQSENDPYASRVLAKHWPHVPNLGDITTIDWSTVERPDLICGGYPCQPFSVAGRRAGDADERHLWPYMRNALGILRPRMALLENVPGHLGLGFDTVLSDLADLGFDVEWSLVSACSMGASHMRQRLFALAHAPGERSPGGNAGTERRPLSTRRMESQRLGGINVWPTNRAEPGLVGGSHGIPSRVDRVRTLGNAVVPQVAEWIGRRIMEAAA